MHIYQLQHLQVPQIEERSLGIDLFIQYWKKRGEVLQTEAKTTFSQVKSAPFFQLSFPRAMNRSISWTIGSLLGHLHGKPGGPDALPLGHNRPPIPAQRDQSLDWGNGTRRPELRSTTTQRWETSASSCHPAPPGPLAPSFTEVTLTRDSS